MPKDIQCCFAVHVDAVAGWIGSYGGEDSPADISRGLFAGEIGSMRLLELFRRWGIKTSWFVPGHSAETFPDQMKRVADAGHEFGVHGYTHENPIAMTPDQEEAVLVKCIEVLTKLTGTRPRGHIAPWWELSTATAGLLLKHGFRLRPQHVPQRSHAVLRPGRRPLDGDRLFAAPADVDEAARARQRNRPHRDPRELVPRRPATDDVHQEGAEQPRLRQSARHRGPVARPVRLGLSRDGLCGVPDRHPSRRRRAAAGAADAGAALRLHGPASGRALHHARRDGGRFCRAACRARK